MVEGKEGRLEGRYGKSRKGIERKEGWKQQGYAGRDNLLAHHKVTCFSDTMYSTVTLSPPKTSKYVRSVYSRATK